MLHISGFKKASYDIALSIKWFIGGTSRNVNEPNTGTLAFSFLDSVKTCLT